MKQSLRRLRARDVFGVRALARVLVAALFVCALASVTASAQKSNARKARPQPQNSAQAKKTPLYYSCPMHQSVKAAKAGKCPKCGMDLRPVFTEAAAETTPALPPVETKEETHAGYGQGKKMTVPDVELLNQDGQKIHFYRDLVKDKVVVINFIFTTCTTICPPLGATFARVQKELGERVGRDVSFISVSVDPVTDTPERLKAWGAKFHAGAGWTFVTGDKSQIDQLLKAFAAEVARREDHSPTVIVVNDAKGIVTRTYGLARPAQIIKIIDDAIAGIAAGTPAESSMKEQE